MIWDKPLIPTNHLLGHIYANFIDNGQDKIQFPAIGLIVSGGHTDLILIKDHGDIKWLGGTRDDAAGEALDKVGRLLNLPYPGGPHIEKLAREGDQKKYIFPRPLIGSGDFDFSFSGLKTAVHREIKSINKLTDQDKKDISAGVQSAVIDIIIRKTLKAIKKYNANSLLLGGGVTANSKLTEEFKNKLAKNNFKTRLFVPPKNLCTDNGAMIASAAFYNDKRANFITVNANPGLYFD
jgi:N6-L-threonylcarbamoyladenine synthase